MAFHPCPNCGQPVCSDCGEHAPGQVGCGCGVRRAPAQAEELQVDGQVGRSAVGLGILHRAQAQVMARAIGSSAAQKTLNAPYLVGWDAETNPEYWQSNPLMRTYIGAFSYVFIESTLKHRKDYLLYTGVVNPQYLMADVQKRLRSKWPRPWDMGYQWMVSKWGQNHADAEANSNYSAWSKNRLPPVPTKHPDWLPFWAWAERTLWPPRVVSRPNF